MDDARRPAIPAFGIAFQPIVDLAGRRVTAQEALVRGIGGRPAASVLARVAPEARSDFELAVITYAMARAVGLGLSVDLHVNLSPSVLARPCGSAAEAAERLMRLAEAERFPLHRLVIEVTEGERIDNPVQLRQFADALRTVGFRLALDDFGAGYNNLALLADVEPDIIKIDMALTRGLDRDRARRAIVAGVLRMVEGEGVRIIAEGVETAAEMTALVDLGIREMQGYLFGAPAYERLHGTPTLPPARRTEPALASLMAPERAVAAPH